MALDRRVVVGAGGVALGVALVGGAVWLSRRPAGPVAGAPLPPASVAQPIESAAKRFPNLKKVLDDPKVGSVLKEFVTAYQSGGVEAAKALARDRGFMNAASDVTLTVLTENDETAALEGEITALGANVVGRGDQSIDVVIPWSVVEARSRDGKPPEELLDRLSSMKNVRGVLPMERPTIDQRQGPQGGRTVSEGVRITRADAWHRAGFRGKGVKVGVLDPEVSKAPRFIGSVLPAGTPVFNGACVSPSGASLDDEGIHGVAAAEIVHEMAPEAEIFLACSLGDEQAGVDWLVRQGVKIISYSAGGMYGPRNGTGRSQSRINDLARRGILWVNSSGNDANTFHRGQLQGGAAGTWHAFAPGRTALGFKTGRSSTIRASLIWNEWSASLVSDYDLYIFDASMREVARSANRNSFIRQPMESITKRLAPNSTYYVGIQVGTAARAIRFVLNVHDAKSIEQNVRQGSITAPSDAVGAIAVGAVGVSNDQVTSYSGRGPTEDNRLKPDISAPSEVVNDVYGGTFAGTSAAAPHVAGAAAVIWGRFPNASRDEVVTTLTSRARDLGAAGPDHEYGAGRLDLGDPSTVAAIVPPQPTSPAPTVAPTVPPGRPTVRPVPPPAPTPAPAPTPSPPSTPRGNESDDGPGVGAIVGVTLGVLGLGAVGVVVVIVGAVSMIRSIFSKPPPPAFAPAPFPAPFPAPPMAGAGAPAVGPLGPRVVANPVAAPASWPAAGPRLGAHAAGWAASLVPTSGLAAGRPIALVGTRVSIGRGAENALVIPAPMVSHRHAAIEISENGCFVDDLGSSNGTFVNGQRVQRHFLRPGDVVQIGPSIYRFEVKAVRA